jgi:ATP-binding cassette subfamily B protein
MNYKLVSFGAITTKNPKILSSIKKLLPLISKEKYKLITALVSVLVNSGLTIAGPLFIGFTIDHYLIRGNYSGVIAYTGILIALYLGVFLSGYIQTRVMGGVGQRILFRLRGLLFTKIQSLPVAFFNQNKAGDLISRINNDTDKLNQFFSRSVVQFIGNVFIIIGAGIAMLVVNTRLGGAALLPAVGLIIFARLTSSWIKRSNRTSLQALGGLSAQVQESLENFRVIVAFNRRNYFRERFQAANNRNYKASLHAGIANNTYQPVFGFVSNVGTLIVVTYGLVLISNGNLSFGILISYLAYVSRFYDPLRQMASIWSDLQSALAAWDRISEILRLNTDLQVIHKTKHDLSRSLLEFRNVTFGYDKDRPVVSHISFSLEPGKTYALVGPTGGGKSTTASLMARLYDPTDGTIFFKGQDIRSYAAKDRTKKIGFILQEPFLFSGTVGENILYGNATYAGMKNKDLQVILKKEGLSTLIDRFDKGLNTHVDSSGSSISLGQKQLIAFMQAVLRHPDLLILDEATANIDTVTEQLLDSILKSLPKTTTVVIIAHRLNTIADADQILFVNDGTLIPAGSLQDAVAMLKNNARKS